MNKRTYPLKPAPAPVQRLNYSVDETAVALGIGRTKVYDLIAQGLLHPIKFGNRTLVPLRQIETLCGGAA